MTNEMLLELYYSVQEEYSDLPTDVVFEIAELRASPRWTLETEEDLLATY